MAFDLWQAAGLGDMSDSGSYSTGAVPSVSNGSLVFPAGVNQAATTNMAQLTAIDFDLILVEPGFTANIGGSGNHMDTSADLVKFYGSGEFWYKDGGGTTDLMIIQAAAGSTVVGLTGSVITHLVCNRGMITVDGSAGDIVDLEVGYVNSPSDVTLTLTANGANVTGKTTVMGGNITSHTTITDLRLYGGTWTQDTAKITEAHIGAGATLIHKDNTTIDEVHAFPGSFADFTQVQVDSTTTTLTITNLFEYEGSRVSYDPSRVTITNHYKMRGV